MRLLNAANFAVKFFGDNEVPPYAILSHTWDKEEVTLQDMEGTHAANKKGYEKIESCCSVVTANRFEYVWMDTCCIDKTSSAELSEAINSMYRWYQEAEVCYVYLADVPSKKSFSESRWFTRGWTLQELIAPSILIFLDEGWKELGTKETLRQDISNVTGIPVGMLSGDDDLETFSIAQRMSWAAKRETSRTEDRAYCLMGIFGINMPLIYGERETAFIRLQEEIMRISDDHSLFAWRSHDNRGGLLATSPASFVDSYNVVQFNPFDTFNTPLTVSSRGVHLELRFIGRGRRGLGLVILHCKEGGGEGALVAIYVRDSNLTMERFERVESGEFERLDLRKFRSSQYPVRRICIQIGRMKYTRKSEELAKCDSIPLEIYSDDILMNLLSFGKPTAVLHAAKRGLEDDLWLLLTKSDIDVNMKDEIGWTALSHAVMGDYEAIVRILIARIDVDVEAKDSRLGRTPLWLAARRGNEAVAKLLLNKGADLENGNNDGQTPLSIAALMGHEAVVKLLLERGADLKTREKYGRKPIWQAAERGHGAVVKLLVEKGASLQTKDKDGRTPLSVAAWMGHEAVVKLLLERGADLKTREKYGQTPLSVAAGRGHEAVVKLLLERGANLETKDSADRTPLSVAAWMGHEAVVKLLLERGANLETKDSAGRTPLSVAAWRGDEAMVKLLLNRGADLENKNKDGRTPLSVAVRMGHDAVVRLLEKGS